MRSLSAGPRKSVLPPRVLFGIKAMGGKENPQGPLGRNVDIPKWVSSLGDLELVA